MVNFKKLRSEYLMKGLKNNLVFTFLSKLRHFGYLLIL